MMHAFADGTIAAVSTPPGKGGVAIIRCSGDRAHDIARLVFRPMGARTVNSLPMRYACYGHVMMGDTPIDDALLTLFDAPHTYTGEPLFEIACHGGILVTRTVLDAVLAAGARMAEAGEFTRRAFLSGKLSLSDAEAIGDLLEAETVAEMRLASIGARSALSKKIEGITEQLLHLVSSVYAMIDFPDEDLAEQSPEEIEFALSTLLCELSALSGSYETGRAVTDGIKAVICGSPNVGKSSLYNALLGEDCAIVTEKAGTTRDLLTATATAGRVKLRLTDTAGLRTETETTDEIELIGIRRAKERLASAELVIAVFDASKPLSLQEKTLLARLGTLEASVIIVLNKSDLKDEICLSREDFCDFSHVVSLSASRGEVENLTALIEALFTDGKLSIGEDAILLSARQHAAVERARAYVQASLDACRAGVSPDVAFQDLEHAIGALGDLDGQNVTDALVDHIFHRFCVGK